MRGRAVGVLFVIILVFLTGCRGGTPPATRDGSSGDLPEGTDIAGGVASTSEAVTAVSPSPTASSTLTPTATATPGPAATDTPLPTATSSPTATEAPTRQPTPTPTVTSSPVAAITEELVVKTECGGEGALRLSRVYWGEQSPMIPSSEGKWVAQTRNPDGDAQLVVTRAGSVDPVIVDAPDSGLPLGMPFWAPPEGFEDQVPRVAVSNVTLSQPGGGSIYVVNADGSDLTHVADYVGYHDDLAWSPDGKWIAYTSAATVSGSGSGMQVRDYQVLVVPADGSAEPVVANPGCSPRWQIPAPQVVAFEVMPAQAAPGDTVSLAWQARGDRATLCPTSRYTLFTAADCWQAPASGFTKFFLPPETEGFQYVDLILKVETLEPAGEATAQATVALVCQRTWFFSDEAQAGICPLEPVRTQAAAQHFERGLMIWLREGGRYYVLQDAPVTQGAVENRVDILVDPLEITGDTSGEFQAPPGLYSPVSGFGLVWRGDVAESPGYRDSLGWAVEPEFGYEAVVQCDDARPSGGRSWQTCYLLGPDDEVIVLPPPGGWMLFGD